MSFPDNEAATDPIDELAGQRSPLLILTEAAEKLDSMADTAELMGDDAAAIKWRSQAGELRLRAMTDM